MKRKTLVFIAISVPVLQKVGPLALTGKNVTVFLDLQGMSVNVSIFEYIRGPNANFLVYLFLI